MTIEALGSWLRGYLEREHGLPHALIDRARSLAELELDSVELVSALAAIEDFLGVGLAESVWAEFDGVDSFCRRLLERPPGGAAAPAPQGAGFSRYVNRHLGDRLARLRLDKTFVRGSGSQLYDAEGRAHLDFVAGYGAVPFGHDPEAIWSAMASLRERGEPSLTQPSAMPAASELAARLTELAPEGFSRVCFGNSGAEAVEAALKLCRAATRRAGILSCSGGFHGKTWGALAATANPYYREGFGPRPAEHRSVPFGDAQALDAALREDPDVAAFIVEPVQGEAGAVCAPPGYFAAVSEICRVRGVPIVADEVQTGLGRTGRLFASPGVGLRADVITLAKALGGGLLPIGACLYRGELATRSFDLKHSSTFGGNALACRVGLRVLELLTSDGERVLANVRDRGRQLTRGLRALCEKHPRLLREVRGEGLLLGVRLASGDDAAFLSPLLEECARQDLLAAVASAYLLNVHGVRVAPALNGADVVRVEPPLNVSQGECERFLAAFAETAERFAEGDAGRILAAIHGERPLRPVPRGRPRRPEPAASASERFAFLLHPLDLDDYLRFDPTLGCLSPRARERLLEGAGALLEPFRIRRVPIRSALGHTAIGDFVLIPYTTRELLALPPAAARDVLERGLQVAREGGARRVGLGAYTSVTSAGGRSLRADDLWITTGNALTVVVGERALVLAADRIGLDPGRSRVAIVGATGSIGSAVSVLLACSFARLALIGSPLRSPASSRRRLQQAAAALVRGVGAASPSSVRAGSLAERVRQMRRDGAGADAIARRLEALGELTLGQSLPESLCGAQAVVTATSTPSALLDPGVLAPGSIVCDLSRPRNVSREAASRARDTLVLDGGLVGVPGEPDLEVFGLLPGHAFACMAETMLLALAGEAGHFSYGPRVELGQVLHVAQLAERHGFTVAEPRSFDRTVSPDTWQRLRACHASHRVA